MTDEFSATFLAQLRTINRHQQRRQGELHVDIATAARRLEALREELAETERGIAETDAILEKYAEEGGE